MEFAKVHNRKGNAMGWIKFFGMACLFFLFGISLYSIPLDPNMQPTNPIQPMIDGPVHEAFVQPITESLTLDSVNTQPPPPITERLPPQIDPQTQWIHGYWAWSEARNDFIWIGGVWRRPPPGQIWIPGFWQQFEEGWAWIHGLWSPVPESQLTYIDLPPPDPLEEDIPPPPGEGYFWVNGYWSYSQDSERYFWLPGQWIEMDPNWVLVPAHYVWRLGGYAFISYYWDWPLNNHGQAYAPVFIDPNFRSQAVYEPETIAERLVIVQQLFINYPDYAYSLQHDYYYQPDFWNTFSDTYADVPPWWGWPTWWGFTWRHHWGLWYWYCHPGYPQPHWLTPEDARSIRPPSGRLLNVGKRMRTPAIVTPHGVVSPNHLLNTLAKVRNKSVEELTKRGPVVPHNPQALKQIHEELNASRPANPNIVKPSGSATQEPLHPPKPNFKKLAPVSPLTRTLNEKLTKIQQSVPSKPVEKTKVPTVVHPQPSFPESNKPAVPGEVPKKPVTPQLQKKLPEQVPSTVKQVPENQIPITPKIEKHPNEPPQMQKLTPEQLHTIQPKTQETPSVTPKATHDRFQRFTVPEQPKRVPPENKQQELQRQTIPARPNIPEVQHHVIQPSQQLPQQPQVPQQPLVPQQYPHQIQGPIYRQPQIPQQPQQFPHQPQVPVIRQPQMPARPVIPQQRLSVPAQAPTQSHPYEMRRVMLPAPSYPNVHMSLPPRPVMQQAPRPLPPPPPVRQPPPSAPTRLERIPVVPQRK